MGEARTSIGVGARLDDRSDGTLVRAAHAGDRRAAETLTQRYRIAARARAAQYFLTGADRDDLHQEALIGLTKAIRDFDPDHGASFAAFAELCMTRQILTAIKTANRLKHSPLNSYVPIDGGSDDSGSDVEAVLEHVGADPVEAVVAQDDMARLREIMDAALSRMEQEVLQLYVDGRSYQEIADALGRGAKAVDNALQRIKKKLEARLDRKH